MSVSFESARFVGKNYTAGFPELLGRFVKAAGEVLSDIEIVTPTPFIPSLGKYETTVAANLRVAVNARYSVADAEPGAPSTGYSFDCEINSYDRSTGKISFTVLSLNKEFWPKLWEHPLLPRKGFNYLVKLTSVAAFTCHNSATSGVLAPVFGGSGGSDDGIGLELALTSQSNSLDISNYRVTSEEIFDDFQEFRTPVYNFNPASLRRDMARNNYGVYVYGESSNYPGFTSYASPVSNFSGVTTRSGFLELAASGVNSQSGLYLGLGSTQQGEDVRGTFGYLSTAPSHNAFRYEIDFLLPALSNGTNRYRVLIGLIGEWLDSAPEDYVEGGLWLTYQDDENSGRFVLRWNNSIFPGSAGSSNTSITLAANTWYRIVIAQIGAGITLTINGTPISTAGVVVPENSGSSAFAGLGLHARIQKLLGTGKVTMISDFVYARKRSAIAGAR